MAVVLEWEKLSPLYLPHNIALLILVLAKLIRVKGSGPDTRRVPSSANPMARVGPS
jgi:hypothetical protein